MRFQLGSGWLIDATMVPASTIFDYGNKADHELTPPETLGKGLIPPIDACAWDADAAIALWRAYPHCRERLRRKLDDVNQKMFEQLLRLDETVLRKYWP